MGEEETPKIAEPAKSTDGVKTDSTNQLLSSQGNRIDKLEETFEKRLATNTTNLITVFGIFASIVTFLSIELQIFKSICDPLRLVGFSLIVLASLLSFLFLLHLIANFWINEKAKEYPKMIIVLIGVFFLVGGIFLFQGRDEMACKENAIFQKYSNDFDKRQLEIESNLQKDIEANQNDFNEKLKKLEDKLSALESKE